MVAASKMAPPDAFAKFASFYTRNRPTIQRGMTGVLGLYITWACLGGLGGNSKGGDSKSGGRRRSSKGKGGDADSSKPVRVQVCFCAILSCYWGIAESCLMNSLSGRLCLLRTSSSIAEDRDSWHSLKRSDAACHAH